MLIISLDELQLDKNSIKIRCAEKLHLGLCLQTTHMNRNFERTKG